MRHAIAALCWGLLLGLGVAANPVQAAQVRLWRLDCGTWPGREMIDSCYLIRHDKSWMLWDTGMGAEMLGHPQFRRNTTHFQLALDRTLVSELAQLDVTPAQIGIVGISHLHYDHVGQAVSFPNATLMMGARDFEAMAADPALEPERLSPWIKDHGKKILLDTDHDVFGDGTVVMLSTPGHTKGHYSLLVRLKNTGPVLLSGDLYYSTQQRQAHEVGARVPDPGAIRASFARFDALADKEHATVIIQHEPGDIAKLPAFPAAAD